MYSLLRSVKAFTCDRISKVVSIQYGKDKIQVKVDRAQLHVYQEGNQLKIYVPREQRRRQVCLARHLPIALLKEFGVSDSRRGAELGSILTATSQFAVDAILDLDGIIDVPEISSVED
jgi:hypothetical protein